MNVSHRYGDCSQRRHITGRDRIHIVMPPGTINTTLPIQPDATNQKAGAVRCVIQAWGPKLPFLLFAGEGIGKGVNIYFLLLSPPAVAPLTQRLKQPSSAGDGGDGKLLRDGVGMLRSSRKTMNGAKPQRAVRN
jgi:hypothetical protein